MALRSITIDKTLRFLAVTLVVVIATLLIYRFSTLVIFAIIAIIISYLLDPIVNKMQSSGINRTVAILMVISGLFLIIYFISTNVLPPLVEQVINLSRQLNTENISVIATTIDKWVIDNIPFVPEGFVG